jgi:hypothetical protein
MFHHRNQHMTQQMEISNVLLVELVAVALWLFATQSMYLVLQRG